MTQQAEEETYPEKCRACTWPLGHRILKSVCVAHLRLNNCCARPPDCPFCKTEMVDDTSYIRHYKCRKCGYGNYLEDIPAGEYIRLGDVAHHKLNTQTQTAYYYLKGLAGHPEFGKGLRYKDHSNYHEIVIHIDDVKELIRRIEEWRKKALE